MNILILSSATADALIAQQTGQHRLGPVPLTDGRYFLSADALTSPLFAAQLAAVDYQVSNLNDIRDLLPAGDEEL